MCKNLVEIIDSFDLLLEAQDYVERHPSRAEDSSTDQRFVRFVMTRVLNKMNSLMEVSDTQAAAALLGMEAGMCSEIFWVIDANSYLTYIWDEKVGVDDTSDSCITLNDNGDFSNSESDNSKQGGHGNTLCASHEVGNRTGEMLSDSDSLSEYSDSDSDVGGSDSEIEGNNHTGPPPEDGCGSDQQRLHHHIDAAHELSCPFENNFHSNGRYGSCPLYRVKDEESKEDILEAVPYPMLYRYRGKELRMLNRWEYCSLVKVVKKTDSERNGSDDGNKKTSGRKKSRRFNFDRPDGNSMPIKKSYAQILRSKQCTAKLLQNPPRHPGPKPSEDDSYIELERWVKRANRFGAYYLALFRPEEDVYDSTITLNQSGYCYDWDSFKQFVRMLKRSNREIDRLRLEIMERVAKGWRTKFRNRAILSKYRNRNRTIWSKQEQEEAQETFGKASQSNATNYENDDVFEEYGLDDKRDELLTPREEREILAQVSFSDDLVRTLEGAVEKLPQPSAINGADEDISDTVKVKSSDADFRFAEILIDVKISKEDENSDTENDGDPNTFEKTPLADIMLKVDSFLVKQGLSGDKMVAVNLMKEHYKALYDGSGDSPQYDAPFTIITGGPGTGKSYLVDVFRGMSDTMKLGEQVRAAYFGIAAVNIGGSSLCSFMDIPTDEKTSIAEKRMRPWNPEKLKEFKRRFDVTKVSAVIIDEISTIKPQLLAYLNKRLRELRPDVNKRFGGLAVILLGDFDQLPPVGGDSIPSTIMKREEKRRTSRRQYTRRGDPLQITTAAGMGAKLFKEASHIRLTTQHRSEDEEHTLLLNRMSAGETLDSNDLELYSMMSDDSDDNFRFATILTTGNRERHEFNMLQSKKWAQFYNTNTIRWRRKIRDRTWRGKPKSDQNLARVLAEACFWELFVPGALAFLTFNLNTDLGLANGTKIKYHSVSFSNERDREEFQRKVQEAAIGEVIDLNKPPDIVNVELFPDTPDDDAKGRRENAKRRMEWKQGSITTDGRIVIPVTPIANKKYVKWKHEIIRGNGGYRCRPSKVDCSDRFPIEPAFAVTLHKAQGRTIGKVILCISEHPSRLTRLKWEGLYVGLSRIRRRNDIRLLVRSGDKSTLSYISRLTKDKHVSNFFRGYP